MPIHTSMQRTLIAAVSCPDGDTFAKWMNAACRAKTMLYDTRFVVV
jgi:hypothetical protein